MCLRAWFRAFSAPGNSKPRPEACKSAGEVSETTSFSFLPLYISWFTHYAGMLYEGADRRHSEMQRSVIFKSQRSWSSR